MEDQEKKEPKEGLEPEDQVVAQEEGELKVGSPQKIDPKPPSQVPTSGVYGNRGKGLSKLLLLVLGIIIILVIGATAYLLRGQLAVKPSPSPSPFLLETPIQEPSPSPSFGRSKFTLRVLNGTKKQGLAASASARLKDLGYSIEKVGNATNSAFPKTVVRIKGTLSELLSQLIKDLVPDFEAEDGPSLKDSDTVDAEVILGAK